MEATLISDTQWNYLLRGPVVGKGLLPKKPDYPTLTDNMWNSINFLANTFDSFKKLSTDLMKVIWITIGNFKQVELKQTI